MDNMLKDLNELCEVISRAIAQANEKIRSAGGKLSAGDAEYVNRLAHTLKSVKSVIRMEEEAEMDDGYSERMYSRGFDRGGSYRGSYGEGGSYARGRMNARRDGMGRYSRDGGSYGYSMGGDMVEELRSLMQEAPNDQMRQEMQRLIAKMEQR